jgi:hypothetical protein
VLLPLNDTNFMLGWLHMEEKERKENKKAPEGRKDKK